jgi:hypothetical protein
MVGQPGSQEKAASPASSPVVFMASAFGAPESFVPEEPAELELLEQAAPVPRASPIPTRTARRSPGDWGVIGSSIAFDLAFAIYRARAAGA